MVDRKLLKESLDKISLTFENNVVFKKNKIIKLINKCENFQLYEYSYCCYGLDESCWTEINEAGIWDKTDKEIKNIVLDTFRNCKKFLYDDKRIYLKNIDNIIYIYLYLRDKMQVDYLIVCDYIY